MKIVIELLLLFTVFLLVGCEHATYYTQAAKGQFSLIKNRQSIDDLIKSKKTNTLLKQRLLLVKEVKQYAHDTLKIETDDTFSYYVDIKRPYVVWNVFAAGEFNLQPVEWCFPIAGCVSYRGYFNRQDAQNKANKLREDGYDVHVGGIRAYSTLGWFDDPLLNTFLFDDESDLIRLIIHELAHKKIYIPGDTTFNESFATAVELIGFELWMNEKHKAVSLQNMMNNTFKSTRITELLLGVYKELEALYKTESMPVDGMRQAKNDILVTAYQNYLVLKSKHGWNDDYDQWIQTLNNAKLATASDYTVYVDAFIKIYRLSNSFEHFYSTINEMASLSKTERHQQLMKQTHAKSPEK